MSKYVIDLLTLHLRSDALWIILNQVLHNFIKFLRFNFSLRPNCYNFLMKKICRRL